MKFPVFTPTPVIALALAATLLLGCSPIINHRGYLRDPVAEASIKTGVDTKTTVQKQLGDPSTSATFGGDAWYYISSREKTIAFFDPIVENRQILAVHFDKNNNVTSLKRYTLADGHVVDFETRETPAKGKELTFLQQLFNATPGVPLGGATGQQRNPGNGP